MKNESRVINATGPRDTPARFVRRGIETTISKEMNRALDTIRRVATTDLSVLIIGEQGSGREWAAHAIHQMSPRAAGPFHVIDCAAISEDQMEREIFGYETITWNGIDLKRSGFDEAVGGTLVIEEIEGLPRMLQMKIAQAVEYRRFRHVGGETERTFDTRVVATIRTGDQAEAAEASIHSDLLHRFSPIIIQIPPLRRRKEDIVMLIETYIEDLRLRFGCAVEGISRAALETCEAFDWPGNLRQLRSAIEYASIMSDGKIIDLQHLPPYILSTHDGRQHK